MIVQPVRNYKTIKLSNNKDLIDSNLWQKPTDQQKKLLLNKNFEDENSKAYNMTAVFFTMCLLAGLVVVIEKNITNDILFYIILGLALLMPLWRIYFAIKNKEKILRNAIEKDNFTVLTNVTIINYIIDYYRGGDPYCTGFLIEIAGKQYKISNFSGHTNYNKDNKELEFNKVMLVKVNIKSGFFKESDKLKLFFYE